jgi:hypothetical protein
VGTKPIVLIEQYYRMGTKSMGVKREQTTLLWFKVQYEWVGTNIWVFGEQFKRVKNKTYGLREQYKRIGTKGVKGNSLREYE